MRMSRLSSFISFTNAFQRARSILIWKIVIGFYELKGEIFPPKRLLKFYLPITIPVKCLRSFGYSLLHVFTVLYL